ncbi:MAG: hypothetical protein QM496_22145 [Verrucomicrobiota bacterium]
MKTKLGSILRGVWYALLLGVVFVAGVIFDEYLRSRYTVSIPVDTSNITGVKVAASRKPDFLWLGTAWWIDTDSPVAFELEIDSSIVAKVPAGAHKIFYNHDYNNLSEFDFRFDGDHPSLVSAQRSSHE